MPRIILLNKPYHVLSQFSDEHHRSTLKDFLPNHPGFYVAGRLDYDSEGLLILTDCGPLQHYIAHPQFDKHKTYWVQVEGELHGEAIKQLEAGLNLKDGRTKPCRAAMIPCPPGLWDRTPPIRQRQHIPTSWLSLQLTEGKNRQVRRMTAAVGFPTLRLIRASIADWSLEHLQPGEFKQLEIDMPVIPRAIKTTTQNKTQASNQRQHPNKQARNRSFTPRVRKRPDRS